MKKQLMVSTFERVVLPRLKKLRDKVMARRAHAAAQLSALRPGEETPSRAPEVPGMIFAIDGESSCLEAAMLVVANAIELDESEAQIVASRQTCCELFQVPTTLRRQPRVSIAESPFLELEGDREASTPPGVHGHEAISKPEVTIWAKLQNAKKQLCKLN